MLKKIAFVSLLVVSMFSLACGGSGGGSAETADSYPSKSVSIVVPFSAGGGSDITTRALVEAAKADFNNNISVENRTGGTGIVGMLYGAKSKADGYVISMLAPELIILQNTGSSSGLTHRDFAPILMFNSAYSAITVKADSPYNTLSDLIEASKAGDIQMGNSGINSIWHLAAAGMANGADTTFTYVPFEGAAPAITDLLGGHIDAVSVSYDEVRSQIEAGELKALAVLAPERLSYASDVPTAIESGYDVVIGTWRGLAVPKETPADVVEKLRTIFVNATANEQFIKLMGETRNYIDVIVGDDFYQRMEDEDVLYGELSKQLAN